MSGLNGSLSSSSTETLKSSPPPSQEAKLTNGVTESQAMESSVDDPPLNVPLPETDSNSDNSLNGSPLTKDKVDRQQVSHERQDSASSYGVAPVDSDLSEASVSSNRVLKVVSGEMDIPSAEVAVAYSPDGRFLKYDIEIGRGSFKTVYKGLDTETGVAIAWCELQEKRYNKAEQARFKEEVAILKTLQHPNILKLYDSWGSTGHRTDKKDKVKDKVLVLVTELMTSGTLKSYMRRLKSIKPKVIRSWGRQILKGLHFLHTRMPSIIHRDLKCDNIFINGTTGLVKIGDLGLATLKRNDVTTVIGTPEFMAPEMYEESYDESVDVYAFGMCLLEMCTQEYPYMECSNPAQIYKRVTQGIKPHAIDKVKDVALRSIIEKCTTPNKFNRLTVAALLSQEYFSENIKIDVVPASDESQSLVTMRMDVPNQDTSKKNGQESIEFTYDLTKDVPENVVREMVKSGILVSSVQQMVSRSLREYVETFKQKQGRNKSDATNPEGKLAEMKSETLSHTPSPSPGMSTESSPGESEQSTAPVLRQPSVNDLSKLEENSGAKEASQGPDMTGQGVMPQPAERDRGLSFSAGKTEPKVSENMSPVNGTGHSLLEHTLSTSQQVTASTGQALPPVTAPKESSVTTTPPVSTASSALIKEAATVDKLVSNPLTPSVEVSQDNKLATEQVMNPPLQELHVSDTTTEAIQQSSHEPEAPGTGTLKRKSVRLKGKGIRVSFIEKISDNKIVCQLATSNSKILKYQFSIKYDKPEEMFRKFVEKNFLTDQDKDEFIQQSKLLIQNAKKAKDSAQESKSSGLIAQETQLKSRSSTEPALSPPTEATDPVATVTSEPQTDTRTRVYSSSNFSPKLESQREHYSRAGESGGAQEPQGGSEGTPRDSTPTNGSKQPTDNVSSLVTHGHPGLDPTRPPSPKALNPLIMAVQLDPLYSNSMPSLHSNLAVSLPSSNSSPQYPGTGSLASQPPIASSSTRIFEVENVAEDKPDSPDSSDLSVCGSTENLGRETLRSDSQDSNPAKKFVVQAVPSLESKSDSFIGKDPPAELPPNKQPPTTTQQPQVLNRDDSKASRHNSLPYVLPSSVTKPSANVSSRSASIPEHYSTTSILDRAPQRGGITEDTYINPSHKYSHTVHSSGYSSYPPSEAELSTDPSDPHPSDQHTFNMDQLPQAALLSEAFMRFMHSMSLVFRDPTFQPLMNTLDRKFGLQEPVPHRTSRQEYPAPSRPEPGSTGVGHDVEFRSAIEEIEEEQRKLERRKQRMIEDFKKRKGSSGNSSVEGSSDGRKISTISYDSSITQSPTQARRQAKLEEYEEAGNALEGRSNSCAITEMERRVKDELTADKLMNMHQSIDILPSSRSRTPLHQPSPSQPHFNQPLNQFSSSHVTVSQAHSNQGPMAQRHSVQGPAQLSANLFQGTPSQAPLRAVSSSEPGGSVSPALQASPPPTQTLGQSTFLMHSPGGSTRFAHTDSAEWTEYTSAPVPAATEPRNGRGELKTQSKADVSEFDPITTHLNSGQFSRPKS